LKATELASDEQRKLLHNLLQETNLEEKVKRVRDLFDEIGVKSEAQKMMQQHQNAALNALKEIDSSDEAKSVLVELADFLFTREV
jgi:geranylgeranyl diphosphate synthase type II